MKFARNFFLGLAGASLAVSPAIAAPAGRSAEPVEDANSIETTGWIGIIGVILVVALAVIAATNDDDNPVSP